MKKPMLTVALVCVLATACKVESKKAEPGPVGPTNSPRGFFTANPSGQAPDEKLVDCQANGDQIDSRLLVGQRLVTSFEFFPAPAEPPVARETRIEDLNANAGSATVTVRALVNGHDIWTKSACLVSKLNDPSGPCMVLGQSDEAKALSEGPVTEVEQLDCEIVSVEKPEEIHLENGSYMFLDGRVVQATRTTLIQKGLIQCRKTSEPNKVIDFGHGAHTTVTMASVDIPALYEPFTSCGQRMTEFFTFSGFAKDDGTAISAYKSELQEIADQNSPHMAKSIDAH